MELASLEIENSGGEKRVKESNEFHWENVLSLESLWAFDQMGSEN